MRHVEIDVPNKKARLPGGSWLMINLGMEDLAAIFQDGNMLPFQGIYPSSVILIII